MTDDDAHERRFKPPAAVVADTAERKASRAGPAMLVALVAVQTVRVGRVIPACFKLTDVGSMSVLNLLELLIGFGALALGAALLHFGRRSALAAFIVAVLGWASCIVGDRLIWWHWGDLCVPSLVLAVVGAVMARAQRRR